MRIASIFVGLIFVTTLNCFAWPAAEEEIQPPKKHSPQDFPGPNGDIDRLEADAREEKRFAQETAARDLKKAMEGLNGKEEDKEKKLLEALGKEPNEKELEALFKDIQDGMKKLEKDVEEKTGQKLTDEQKAALNKYAAKRLLDKGSAGLKEARSRLVKLEKAGEVAPKGSFDEALLSAVGDRFKEKEFQPYHAAVDSVQGLSRLDASMRLMDITATVNRASAADWSNDADNRNAMDHVASIVGSQLPADRDKFVAALPAGSPMRQMAGDIHTQLKSGPGPQGRGKLVANSDDRQYTRSMAGAIEKQKDYEAKWFKNLDAAGRGDVEAMKFLQSKEGFTQKWASYTKDPRAFLISGLEMKDGRPTEFFQASKYREFAPWLKLEESFSLNKPSDFRFHVSEVPQFLEKINAAALSKPGIRLSFAEFAHSTQIGESLGGTTDPSTTSTTTGSAPSQSATPPETAAKVKLRVPAAEKPEGTIPVSLKTVLTGMRRPSQPALQILATPPRYPVCNTPACRQQQLQNQGIE